MTCSCAVCKVFKRFVSGQLYGVRVYEILTGEFVDQLAAHIWRVGFDCLRPLRLSTLTPKRARCFRIHVRRSGSSAQHENTILEVGAGNGRLGYFLARKLNSTYPCHCLLLPTSGPEYGCGPSKAEGEQAQEGESREGCLRKFRIACTDSSARGLSGAPFPGALMHAILSVNLRFFGARRVP